MPLFAAHQNQAISAFDADDQILYQCLECRSTVKLRKQKGKLPHFYHLKATPSCRLYSKSNEHLLAQIAIQKMLPIGEARLEHPFPSIRRIADVSWEKQKIIFEIQCSFISEEEAQKRSQDYASLGYQIVWILEDRFFNQKIVRKTESYLRKHLCYFVQIQPRILFYDQMEIIQFPKRLKKGSKIPIFLSKAHPIQPSYHSQMQERILNNRIYFENDLVHKALNPSYAPIFDTWKQLESELTNKSFSWIDKIKKIYIQLLEKALQKMSRA